jgi:DNA-binding YbaB/EbfC family protein
MGQKMLKQLQEMQAKMARIQEELGNKTVTGSAGGGMVEVTVTGHQKVTGIVIKPEVVDPSDVEMLQDLVLAAANEALDKAREMAQKDLSVLTGGLSLPGGLGL